MIVTTQNITDWIDQAEKQGKPLYQKTNFDAQGVIPKRFGEGGNRIFWLRGGLSIEIVTRHFWQPVTVEQHHEESFPLVAKFCLSGHCRIKTNRIPEIESDYEEVADCNYLYYLPDLIEFEEYPSNTPIQTVMICAPASYFQSLNPLPRPLRHLLNARGRFHQPLGTTTLAMNQVLQQIINCPYQGPIQRLYLESKALELLAMQFVRLDANSTPSRQTPIKSADLERVQHARDILAQSVADSLSITELSRQVGLNECTLRRGFHYLFGTTVFGYLRDYRMEQAQRLLRQTDVTIAQVATQVGYRNPEAFSTAFRRKFSISPKAYQMGKFR